MSQNANINPKIDQLKADIDWFYSDDFDLGQAVDRYQKASTLAKEIEKDLTTLKNQIEVIAKDFKGSNLSPEKP